MDAQPRERRDERVVLGHEVDAQVLRGERAVDGAVPPLEVGFAAVSIPQVRIARDAGGGAG
eukprot:7093990-Prymnesium_polylepis.1